MKNYKINAAILVAIVYIFSLLAVILPKAEISESERRKLASFPKFTVSSWTSGKFASDFEKYSTDSFPFRDGFRTVKSLVNYYGFGKLDNNDVYIYNNSMMKLEKELDEKSVVSATEKFAKIYEAYIAGKTDKVFVSVIPDKAYFAVQSGAKIPSLDYEKMFALVKDNMPYAEYIPLAHLLTLEDYYLTDSHWRQEKIEDVAEALLVAMTGKSGTLSYEEKFATDAFRGVYSGQSSLPGGKEDINYLYNKMFDSCIVTNYETGKDGNIYDFEKLDSRDPYEFFLEGSCAAMKIENPENTSGRRLVIFRDSYGSSLTPLLLSGYSEITLLDTRYMNPDQIGDFADFEGADVLFIYSSTLLNSSAVLR